MIWSLYNCEKEKLCGKSIPAFVMNLRLEVVGSLLGRIQYAPTRDTCNASLQPTLNIKHSTFKIYSLIVLSFIFSNDATIAARALPASWPSITRWSYVIDT